MIGRRELLLGCGTDRRKKLVPRDSGGEHPEWADWANLTTLDVNPDFKPDILWDLETLRPLPFEHDTFDEIHAYELLEHIGLQGDWKTLFRQFTDYWRILKPGGFFIATTPCWKSLWAWGDPSHKRVINEGTITFLSQRSYREQLAMTPMTDFRAVWTADFDVLERGHTSDPAAWNHDNCNFIFFLKAVKPARLGG